MTNKNGFTLVEIVIALFVTGVVGLIGANLMEMNLEEVRDINRFRWIDTQRTEIARALRSKIAWTLTVKDATNTSLECLRTKLNSPDTAVDCTGQGGQIPVIHWENDKNGQPVIALDQSGSRGFTDKGEPCTGFTLAGNDQCPFQWTVTWKASCPPAAKCPQPDALIDADLTYAPASGGIKNRLNTANYQMRMVIKVNESRQSACTQTLLGTYNAATDKCELNMQKGCPNPGEWAVGFDKNGNPRCKPIDFGNCGSQLMQGVNGNGDLVCVNACI